MTFLVGFALWLVAGLLAALLARATYAAPGTTAALTLAFAVFGAFVGGMLGMSPYIYHNPVPVRPGGVIGAVAGALFFAYLYHFTARRAV